MKAMRCLNCGEPLPGNANYCAECGTSLLDDETPTVQRDPNATIRINRSGRRPSQFKFPRFLASGGSDPDATQRLTRSKPGTQVPVLPSPEETNKQTPQLWEDQDWLDEPDFEELIRRETWQKVVTRKQPLVPAGPVPPTPPLTPVPLRKRPFTFLKRTRGAAKTSPTKTRDFSLGIASWVFILGLIFLLLGGAFGVYVSLGRGTQKLEASSNLLALQVTPSSIAVGGIITLRGTHFSPRAHIGLSRDSSIPVNDTAGMNILSADSNGSFEDTVVIDQTWQDGPHTIHAEDALLHKIASFTVVVSGNSLSLKPSHLLLSSNSLDLGSGDQATNSLQELMLSNAGGGQISWQATSTQPWLLVSPSSGTFASGQRMQVAVACDRSNLPIGAYKASIIFTSNAGQATLPVKMSVTPLQPGHEAVLQLTPAVLSFTASDGSANPPAQVVTVSNPGVLPLHWSATASTSDGNNWLSLGPQSGNVAKGSSQAVSISVNSSMLLPGTYNGWITFNSDGTIPTRNIPQAIYVSLTIAPQCSLSVSPGALTFTAAYLQPGPAAKAISVTASGKCSAPLAWTVASTTSNGGQWLSINSARGNTPASPSVKVNTTGLAPGTYNGSLVFNATTGTQSVPVTLTIGQPTAPVMSNNPAQISLSAILGQTSPASQTITIANNGVGTLQWSAKAATGVGGAWLAISPSSGALNGHQSATATVTATLVSSLIAGTYSGTITLSGIDGNGKTVMGSPQNIPVTFTVQSPCAISTPSPALTFQAVSGQTAPPTQTAAISAAGACAHTLNWSASVAPGNGWLTVSPTSGTVSLTAASKTAVGINTSGLQAGSYSGSIVVTATDSVTNQQVGAPQKIVISLTVQPPCTLQAPSVKSETFSSEAGQNPGTQTFTIGIIGNCSGNVTITPTTSGAWLSVSPASANVSSGGSATFTVSVNTSGLAANSYSGSISLAAVNNGITITGSPQTVSVTLTVVSAPALTTNPSSLSFNLATGIASQQITIDNSGGGPLNWSAALDSSAPSFVSISSASSGNGLQGGSAASITITVNATGLQGGSNYSTIVTISGVDPATGQAVNGSPAIIPITITIAAPSMHLDQTSLTFNTTAGTNPASQSITITNTGGGTLSWSVSPPGASWLSVTPNSGNADSGGGSTATFSVDVTGLTAGTYTATVTFTPSGGGGPQTVTVTLTVN
jgi:hypothetical protein